MEGPTIAILVIMLFCGVFTTWMNRQGNVALAAVAAEFPLAPEKAAEIAMEACLTTRERGSRKYVPVVRTAEGFRFEIACRAGVMVFEVLEVRGSPGCRVLCRAEEVDVIRCPEMAGLGASATNVPRLTMGVARNPAKLLRRRERAFRALTRAARGDDHSRPCPPAERPVTECVDEAGRR